MFDYSSAKGKELCKKKKKKTTKLHSLSSASVVGYGQKWASIKSGAALDHCLQKFQNRLLAFAEDVLSR